ncbi:VOC family protein [Petropleomorpha daqingensis]|uniref:Putative enzyme related to lactoylglutathione lyase n=1 Tax=Petropleomorpha daqingensis TaxID=2026353 RepID=A0A853C9X9_9ACTN|nr:VOC family protein [Petropleomorpha daqingensis]NYJ03816.1 putative enzyme related to lactoylglutathione lyase [Petropleomorpha daqingensis]
MTDVPKPFGMTLQVQVDDLERARRFFCLVLGRAPEFDPQGGDVLAWRVGDGETWLEVVGVTGPVRPLVTRVRFGIDDLNAARATVEAAGTPVSAATSLPGLARWADFTDPWGNQLGFYEVLDAG